MRRATKRRSSSSSGGARSQSRYGYAIPARVVLSQRSMKIAKRKPQTRRTVERIAKKVLRTAEKKAKKLLRDVKKLGAARPTVRVGKRTRKKVAAARPRKRATSRVRPRAT